MKVLLISPKWLFSYGPMRRFAKLMNFLPPLGLCYLASSAEKLGHYVKILDCEAEELEDEDILKEVENFDLVGISATTPTFPEVKRLSKIIKDKYKIPLAVGGPHITLLGPQSLKDTYFDFGFVGDSEYTFSEFLTRLESGRGFEDIPGIIFRKNGDTVFTGKNKPQNFDDIPFPARDKLKILKYVWYVPREGKKITTSFQTSRGCPLRCIFCSESTLYPKVLLRSPENVIEELKEIKNETPIRHIVFVDDTITLHMKRAEKIFELMEEEKLGFTFECETVANRVDEKLAEKMVRAGLKRINFGIESGDPKILEIIGKGVKLEDLKRAYRIFKSLGVETRGSIILGVPYENSKTVLRTIKFISNLKDLDFAYINIASPFPGTKMRDMFLSGEGGAYLFSYDFESLRRYGKPPIKVNDLSPTKLLLYQKIAVLLFYMKPRRIYNLIKTRGFSFIVLAFANFILSFIIFLSEFIKRKRK